MGAFHRIQHPECGSAAVVVDLGTILWSLHRANGQLVRRQHFRNRRLQREYRAVWRQNSDRRRENDDVAGVDYCGSGGLLTMIARAPITIRGSTGYPKGNQPAETTAAPASARQVQPGEDCPHRGLQVIREIPNTGCGCNGAVLLIYACTLHGECTPRRINAGQEVQACWDCQLDGKDGGLAFPEGSGLKRPAATHETVVAAGGFSKGT